MPFADLIGHEPAVRLLKGQIARKQLATTYLFTGPEGIGKGALALEFARALHCESPKEGDSCGACDSCGKISEGKNPDLLLLASEKESGDIGIDQIRTMENWMSLTPFGGVLKVAILDSADNLTDESTHACLKILEEPPARSLFILLASAPYRLPATLLSRCHKVRLSPQGIERTTAALAKREGIDPATAKMLAISSGGRLGLAVQFQEGGRLEELNAGLNALLAALRKNDLETPFPKASRDEIEEYLEWYAGWLRDQLVLSVGGNPDWVLHQDRLEELKKIVAQKGGASTAASIISQVDRIYRVQEAVQRNASVRTALSVLLSHP